MLIRDGMFILKPEIEQVAEDKYFLAIKLDLIKQGIQFVDFDLFPRLIGGPKMNVRKKIDCHKGGL